MENQNKNIIEKVPKSLRKAPGGLQRPPEGLSMILEAWNAALGKIEKVHRRVLRTTRRRRSIDRLKFRELFRLEKPTGRRKIRSRPNNDSSW